SNAKFQRVLWFAHKMHLTQLVSNFWGAVHIGRGFTAFFAKLYPLSAMTECLCAVGVVPTRVYPKSGRISA
ncbi:hypothetical protein F9222_25005, partial [Escherichia coli]